MSREGSPRFPYTFSSYVTTTRDKLNKSHNQEATDVETNPINMKGDPGRPCLSTHSRMGRPCDHRSINQYTILLGQQPRGMNSLLSRRNTDSNFVLRDTVVLKALYQPTRLPNDHVRSCILFGTYEREVLTSVPLDKGSAVLGKL